MKDLNLEQLDLLFDEIYQNLDVPKSLVKEADLKYEELSTWLKQDSEKNFKSNSLLYPQGSNLLGTCVRAVKSSDDFDYDLVYVREIKKESTTQKELKTQVGDQLKRYLKHQKESNSPEIPELTEGSRCWTLKYGKKFHMDILPAIPDLEGSYTANKEDGIYITDKELREWCTSNPKGYNMWFRAQMKEQINEERIKLAKASHMEVQDIPEHEVKTILQRAIQILKRNRDLTYEGHKDNKPISVIITTLATHSYRKTSSLYQALQDILTNMESFITRKNGEDWVTSPINANENFANKWNEFPERKKAFMAWLSSAKEEFLGLEKQGSAIQLSERLKKSLGDDTVTSALKKFEERTIKRALITNAVNSVTTPTKPHGHF